MKWGDILLNKDVLKILIIVNYYAGKKIARADILKLEHLLKDRGYFVETYYTKCKRDAVDVVEKKAVVFDIVVCCGGDGTFHEVLNGVLNLEKCVPISFIPFGTTNDLAKSLNMPLTLEEAVKNISIKNAEYQDVGLFNEREYFSYIASFGAFCEVSYGTPQFLKNFFGKVAYIFEGCKCVKKIKSYDVNIICDNENISGDFIFGAVTNSYSVAGLIKLKNDGIKFNDGKLEVLLLRKPKNFIELIQLIFDLRKNKFDDKFLILRHAKNIRIRLEKEAPFTLDGEYAGNFSDIYIKCLCKKFKIIK